jgi:hypothetical protein
MKIHLHNGILNSDYIKWLSMLPAIVNRKIAFLWFGQRKKNVKANYFIKFATKKIFSQLQKKIYIIFKRFGT